MQKKYTNLEKARIIELYEHAASTRVIIVAELVHKNRVGREFEKYLGKSKTGWRNNNNKMSIFEKAADSKYKHVKYSTSGNKYKKSPFHVSEVEVLKLAYEHRKKGRKVSQNFIKTKAKIIVLEKQPEKADTFKASNGWFILFCKRHLICFRKHKSGKKYSGEENISKIIQVSILRIENI